MMNSRWQTLAFVAAVLTVTSVGGFAANHQTFTGEVSDTMCGAKHAMAGSPAECTRACISKGSSYALVVGDKVYTLHTTDKTALVSLNDLAGQKAKVVGKVDGDTIEVTGVSPAK